MKRMTNRVLALFIAVQMTGCAGFRAGELGEIPTLPEGDARKSLLVRVSGRAILNGETQDVQPVMLEQWTEKTVGAFRSSGQFSTVSTVEADPDLVATVSIDDVGNPNFFAAFLSGFTFTVLPAKVSERLTFKTRLQDASGVELARAEKSETITVWIQLFLVFAMPFKNPATMTEQIFQDAVTATLAEPDMQAAIR